MTKPSKAYEDFKFLNEDACRGIRLQLEWLKPDIRMSERGIESTIVIFGSARIPSPEKAKAELQRIRSEIGEDNHDNPDNALRLVSAQQDLEQSRYYAMAREFASLMTASGLEAKNPRLVVMTGGGGGIMEAANRGAAEEGGESIGLNISLPFEQHANRYITQGLNFDFHYFNMRKMHFLRRAKALCAFPGGFGTMDELFEALTLIQTRKIEPIPILLFGREFWEDFIDWNCLIRRGMISPGDIEIFRYFDDARAAVEYIREFK